MANEFPEATARPWTLNVDEYAGNPISGLISIPEIDRCLHDAEWADHEDWQRDLANAELIVTAVNSYDALREAVEAVLNLKWIRDLSLSHRSGCTAITLYDELCNCGLKDYLATDAQLRAALHPQPEETQHG